MLPKSNASNDLPAMLLTTKDVDGLPLARFEYVLARAGVAIPRQTLARWAIGAAQALQPIANLMRDTLLESDVIHMDETPVQVLKEPGRDPTSKSQSGCSAVVRRASRWSCSITIRAAPRRCPCACSKAGRGT